MTDRLAEIEARVNKATEGPRVIDADRKMLLTFNWKRWALSSPALLVPAEKEER